LVAYSGLPNVARFLGQTDAFVFVSMLVLLWVERVPVPRLLQRPLLGIASATLFIYIVNYSVINRVMPHLGLPAWWPVQVGLALATGIVTKIVWDRIAGWVSSLVKRSKWRLSSVNAQWSRSFGQVAAKIS
jgi:surface polysaccharide O-acyltransferase-like enzyme